MTVLRPPDTQLWWCGGLTDSTVSGNEADIVGGGLVNHGSLTLESSTVSGNTEFFGGGGIYNNETGGATITYGIGWNGTVSGNKPDDIFNF